MRNRLLLGVCWLALLATPALANPRPLPFSYTSELLAPGAAELETFVDLTPLRARSTSSGALTWYLASTFQTEIELGLTDHFELGLYFTFTPDPGDAYTNTAILTEGNGLKQRLRWSPAAPGELPVDINLYGEVTENHKAVELEEKIILQRRFGSLRLVANLTLEEEIYYTAQRDIELDGSLGATVEVTPAVHLGLEAWTHTEWPDTDPNPRPFGIGPHVYVGPTALFVLGKVWWSTGAYVRVTDFDHTMAAAEPFGAVWIRTMIGYDL
jgi:hypothetical protein